MYIILCSSSPRPCITLLLPYTCTQCEIFSSFNGWSSTLFFTDVHSQAPLFTVQLCLFCEFNILLTLNKRNYMYLYIYTSHRDTGTQYSVHTSLAVRHGFKLLRLRQTALVQSLSQQICPLSQAKAGLRQDPPPTWSTQGTSLVEGQLVVSERWTYGMETGDWHVWPHPL